MQQRNYIIFIVLSIACLIGWQTFVIPRLLPPRKPPIADKKPADQKGKPAPETDKKGDADKKPAVAADKKPSDNKPADKADAQLKPGKEPDAKKDAKKAATFPAATVVLGSSSPDGPYFLRVELTSKGAAVASIESNDPRYRDLKDPKIPLHIVGSNRRIAFHTFGADFGDIDKQLLTDPPLLAERDWKVAETKADTNDAAVNSSVTFEYPAPDGNLVVQKRYTLGRVKEQGSSFDQEVRDTQTAGYLLRLEVTFKNTGAQKVETSYILQGPVGLPLENVEDTRKYRDLKMGFLTGPGVVNAQTKTARELVTEDQKNQQQEWKAPLKYIGVDAQYFTALVLPVDNQLEHQTVDRSVPMLLDQPTIPERTDISVRLESKPVTIDPKESVTHTYELFAGPERKDLLQSLQAEAVLDFGWFASVSHVMLALLKVFHGIGLPWGVAIICLTVLVRACLFPISLRQTAQAQRMREMQPKLQEIRKKYANDREKLAMANLELMRKYKVNPLGGCLPLLLQFPIFIGLYQALNNAVDLRAKPFLYFSNLAVPDALFHLPMALPILGTDFNLLPIITVALFVVQQKLLMPPPTDEQQALQYKMMNVMTIVMGVLFYHVPAGLCVYFISSSLWGLSERKLLEWWRRKHPPKMPTDEGEPPATTGRPEKKGPGPEGGAGGGSGPSWLQRLMSAADSAGAEAASGTKSSGPRRDLPGKKNGKKSR